MTLHTKYCLKQNFYWKWLKNYYRPVVIGGRLMSASEDINSTSRPKVESKETEKSFSEMKQKDEK